MLYIINYCNPHCSPLSSITRLPEEEAFAAAKMLSESYKGTAFGRFEDFVNYYPRRIRTEKWLYENFLKMGGEPETEHPLYFVVNGSGYLNEWFGNGAVTKLVLDEISSKHISFTFGDSMAKMDKPERQKPFTKEELYGFIKKYKRTVDEFFTEIERDWHYIEAQLWCDGYINNIGDFDGDKKSGY